LVWLHTSLVPFYAITPLSIAPPAKIKELVARFEEHKEAYTQGRYNETQLRRDFLDPFFKALGWDIDNEQGKSEAYRDVIHEDAIQIAGVHKAPDYCMRAAGVRRFFVEAKKPSVDIKGDVDPAFQVRRYAWSAKLPLSILTDFEEFSVYDCRVRPVNGDGSAKARILYFTYKDYEEKWDQIAAIFSPQAIESGSFDKFATSEKRLRGTAEVDVAFLAEIETWRDNLARHIGARKRGDAHVLDDVAVVADEDPGAEAAGGCAGRCAGPAAGRGCRRGPRGGRGSRANSTSRRGAATV